MPEALESEVAGRGNGHTSHWSFQTRRYPILENTVEILVISSDAIDQLVHLVEPKAAMVVLADNGSGGTEGEGGSATMNYATGQIALMLQPPPPEDSSIVIRYAWEPPKYEGAKVCVHHNGKDRWITLSEFRDALMRGRE